MRLPGHTFSLSTTSSCVNPLLAFAAGFLQTIPTSYLHRVSPGVNLTKQEALT